jgi:hypothetical protein
MRAKNPGFGALRATGAGASSRSGLTGAWLAGTIALTAGF